MAWFYLGIAAIFEVCFAIGTKYSDGFSRPLPSFLTAIAVVTGIYFLALAFKTLPVSLAYPVWTGLGVIGTVIFGALLFGESLHPLKLLCIGFILAGIIGLKFLDTLQS
jgi:quaternary ammonium compound-resistance protein SugE